METSAEQIDILLASVRSGKFTRVLHTMARGARIGSAHDELVELFEWFDTQRALERENLV